MRPVWERSAAVRLAYAIGSCTIGSWQRPGAVARFMRAWLKFPIEYAAAAEVAATEAVGFTDMFCVDSSVDECPLLGSLQRYEWNTRLDEQIYIGLIIKSIGARRIFEIGTFDGNMTRYMAEMAGVEAHVFTLDLPASEFDRRQDLKWFRGTEIGRRFRGMPIEERITQLVGDSREFDFSPYQRSMDLVFVDAAHDYVHGVADSSAALQLVRPGGVVIWHDYGWPGLVQAIRETTRGHRLARLRGTTLAIVRTSE